MWSGFHEARCGGDAGWWTKPDFVINELNVQSVITAPAHDEMVPMQAAGNYTVKGFAYSGTHPSADVCQVLTCVVLTGNFWVILAANRTCNIMSALRWR